MRKDTKKEDNRNYGLAGILYDAVSIIITAIMLLAIVFTFCCRVVGVDGTSMNNTLADGDWLIVTPYYSEPKYGDIVIATKKTAARGPLVKRVIGLPGDEVIIDADDNVYVNGIKLNETYALVAESYKGDRTYPVTVPEGCVMLMGDNREVSWDSRFTNIGFIEEEYLLGKAQLRLSSDWDIYYNFDN
ncbi:MAG: signal peptidase I [Oscillospiraceae bacterium]|nr:signal peptidase I [Oscillospiraceae bacterium]